MDSSILSLGTEQLIAEFWSNVDRSAGPDACHPWTGPVDRDGYGKFTGARYAHRLACQAANGPAPFPKAEAAHSCDTPRCCNGSHLSWKTHAANVAEQFQRGNHRNFRKHGRPYICGVCGGAGHNARGCTTVARAISRGQMSLRQARATFRVTALLRQ